MIPVTKSFTVISNVSVFPPYSTVTVCVSGTVAGVGLNPLIVTPVSFPSIVDGPLPFVTSILICDKSSASPYLLELGALLTSIFDTVFATL